MTPEACRCQRLIGAIFLSDSISVGKWLHYNIADKQQIGIKERMSGEEQVDLKTLSFLGLDATKPVFGVSDKTRFKPVSSATETS